MQTEHSGNQSEMVICLYYNCKGKKKVPKNGKERENETGAKVIL